jgi:hypothetical protein
MVEISQNSPLIDEERGAFSRLAFPRSGKGAWATAMLDLALLMHIMRLFPAGRSLHPVPQARPECNSRGEVR